MSRLSREEKREQWGAGHPVTPVDVTPVDVRVSGGGEATADGVRLTAAPGGEVQQAVLDHLHRLARTSGHPVLATIHDDRIGYVVPLQVNPDGSSRFAAEPVGLPAAAGDAVGRSAAAPSGPSAAPRGTTPAPGTVQPPTGVFGPPPVMPPKPEPTTPPTAPTDVPGLAAAPTAPAEASGRAAAAVAPAAVPGRAVAPVVSAEASGRAAAPTAPAGAPGRAAVPDAPADVPVRNAVPVPDVAHRAPAHPHSGTPASTPRPHPTPDFHGAAREYDAKPTPTPARGFDAVAEAVLGDGAEGAGTGGVLAGPMGRINAAVRAGRIEEAAGLAERTVGEASAALGPEHPEVLRLRELTAYIAYLAGDPLRAFEVSLELARLGRRARDAEAAYGNVQSAATAWRAVRDPEQGLRLGADLIALWAELTSEDGPAADDVEELESARARMRRLTARAGSRPR